MNPVLIDLTPAAWMVTDDQGHTSLFKEEVRANQYATHVRGGQVEALVRRSQVMTVLETPDGPGFDEYPG